MNKVSAVSGKPGAGWEKVPPAGNRTESAPADANESRIPKDRVLISEPDMNWNDIIGTVLDRLKEQYPSVSIVIDNNQRDGDIAGLAASLGAGTHLVISQKFIERLGSSTEEFAKCSSILTGIAKQLAGQKGNPSGSGPIMASGAYVGESGSAFWTASKKTEVPAPEMSFNTSSEKKESSYSRLSKTASISVSRHYARLAGARTKGQVQSVLADVQRSMGDLRMTAVYGEEEERVKASRALRSLNKLLSRGGRKISRLNREQLAAMREKRAKREQEEVKATQARQEMKRLRTGRSGSDYSLEREGRADEAYIRGYKHYRQVKGDYEERALSSMDMAGANLSQTGALDMGGAIEGGITAADVTVSGTISF
ncbi:MAG: hypothetical protein QM683_02865 [Lacrimispora sp.]